MATDAAQITVDAFAYDAYGTLFDVHSVISRAEQLAPGRGVALSQLWRTKQLEYTWLQSLMQSATRRRDDFAVITRHALDYAVAAMQLPLDASAAQELMKAYLELAAFPDVTTTLAAIAPRPQVILSNGTMAMLEPLVRRAGLDRILSKIISVDAADVYKPHPHVYRLAVDALQLPPERIGFVSSNGWDAAGAKAFGFTAFWINRLNAPIERHAAPPDRILRSLGDLPALLA